MQGNRTSKEKVKEKTAKIVFFFFFWGGAVSGEGVVSYAEYASFVSLYILY